MAYVTVAGGALEAAAPLANFVSDTLYAGDAAGADAFWAGLGEVCRELGPENAALLARRDELQAALDAFHADAGNHADLSLGTTAYQDFLRSIGYLSAAQPDVRDESAHVCTPAVDPEVSSVSGVQLVVPCDNPRYALNAANARWLSLLDALYGTDAVLPRPAPTEAPNADGSYNAVRGGKVLGYVFSFLDSHFGLVSSANGAPVSYAHVRSFDVVRSAGAPARLTAALERGEAQLADPEKLVGFTLGDAGCPKELVLRHNGLHVILSFASAARAAQLGLGCGLSDVVLESALTAICDFEDSVAAVDAEDKVNVYRTWAGLMRGGLTATFEKSGRTVQRRLKQDRAFESAAVGGGRLTLPGRAVLMCRNVGMQMQTDMVRLPGGEAVPEAFVDLFVSAKAATFDLAKPAEADPAGDPLNLVRNSRAGSVYIVKPKMHGPDEVAFNNRLFNRAEAFLGLAPNALKIGVMDEERRTSMNLTACIAAVRERLVFINTGFLDRTGDEIHTAMSAGPVLGKKAMRSQAWLSAYEDGNVDAGMAMALSGKGQIGKGMWAKPDAMAAMLHDKVAHPKTGASTAWVPSPTAACLHSLHYFMVSAWACLEKRARDTWCEPGTPPLGLFRVPVACPASAAKETKVMQP
mmetsp:Transcript_10432/g.31344  ORF Transcript_10432/g.31344 Transcript_10432/m.31344 type:complete len:638 (-) Transcript_10432:599-2512(-)